MRLYLAGSECVTEHDTVLGDLPNLALLVSFWYIRKGKGVVVVDWGTKRSVPLFLDSGAYSAMTMGVPVDIKDYTQYCLEHADKFAVIASLDVIGDYKATARNHDYMLEQGVKSIPTFHVNAPFSELERLIVQNEYIALGVAGMQARRGALMAWLTQCFRINRGRSKFHGFALTSPVVMHSFPWHSVDSSTWVDARRFAKIIVRSGSSFAGYCRPDWGKIEDKIPRHLMIAKKPTIEQYDVLLRWNAQQMLDWAREYK